MGLRCKPGDLCIVIRSKYGNEGRVVTVVRWLELGERIPEFGFPSVATVSGWLVKAQQPVPNVGGMQSVYGLGPDLWLLPINPPALTDTEPTSTPVPAEQEG